MSFMQGKCPECGGLLAADSSKKATTCPFCGEAFIVQEAINNYNIYNITNSNTSHNHSAGSVVNVFENLISVSSITERAFMFLEDGDFERANEYFEKALDVDPKCEYAYLGKLMVDLKINKESAFDNINVDFEANRNYQKIVMFGNETLVNKLKNILVKIKNKIAEEKRQKAEEQEQIETAYRIKKNAAENVIDNALKYPNVEMRNIERRIDEIMFEILPLTGDRPNGISIEHLYSCGSFDYSNVTNSFLLQQEKLKKNIEYCKDDVLNNKSGMVLGARIKYYKRIPIYKSFIKVKQKGVALGKELDALYKKIDDLNAMEFERLNNGNKEMKLSLEDAVSFLGRCNSPKLKMTFGEWEGVPIIWDVCCIKHSKILLISEKSIFKMSHKDNSFSFILNNKFMNTAFNNDEKSKILTVFKTRPFSFSHKDKIFLLSEDEFEKYSSSIHIAYGESWWLRDKDTYKDRFKTKAVVFGKSKLEDDYKELGICPAMWIEL